MKKTPSKVAHKQKSRTTKSPFTKDWDLDWEENIFETHIGI